MDGGIDGGMCARTHTGVQAYMSWYIHIYLYIHIRAIYVDIDTDIDIYIYIWTFTYTYTDIHVHVDVHEHIHAPCRFTMVCLRTCIHGHRRSGRRPCSGSCS